MSILMPVRIEWIKFYNLPGNRSFVYWVKISVSRRDSPTVWSKVVVVGGGGGGGMRLGRAQQGW